MAIHSASVITRSNSRTEEQYECVKVTTDYMMFTATTGTQLWGLWAQGTSAKHFTRMCSLAVLIQRLDMRQFMEGS
jgi:hypothetical protein